MRSLVLNCPVFILTGRNKPKKNYISMNNSNNWHFNHYNTVKKLYKAAIEKELQSSGQSDIKFPGQVETTFQYFKPSRRRTDKSNAFATQSKFCYDALVELGVLTDDNDDIILTEVLLPTVYDKNHPRVVITVNEVK